VSIVRDEANISPRGEMFDVGVRDELNAVRTELEAALAQAHTVVAAAIQIIGGYSMMNHQGFYLVGRAEYERLQRALEPYRE